jgi:hypothetical protein
MPFLKTLVFFRTQRMNPYDQRHRNQQGHRISLFSATKSRLSQDLFQTKSRLNMLFLKTLVFFRTQKEIPHVRSNRNPPNLRLYYVSRA